MDIIRINNEIFEVRKKVRDLQSKLSILEAYQSAYIHFHKAVNEGAPRSEIEDWRKRLSIATSELMPWLKDKTA